MIEVRYMRRPENVAEVRSADGGGSVISGYAAVFRQYSQNLGGFVEMIEPDAFVRVLNDGNRDVMALYNHDANIVLGARSAGTLTLSTDDIGLRYEIVAPDTTQARDLAVNIGLRNVTGSSFSFSLAADGDEWRQTDEGFPLRVVRSVANLYDVGPVTMPAYLGTKEADAAVALRSLASHTNRSLDEVLAAHAADDLRSMFDPKEDPPAPAAPGAPVIDLRSLRLDLLGRSHPPTR